MSDDCEVVLRYWFGDGTGDAAVLEARGESWFRKDEAADAEIRERFTPLIDRAVRGELESWGDQGPGRLALIVLLDQFPRNIHRDSPDAFAQDHRALAHSLEGQSRGQDRELGAVERVFFYMPMEHAESLPVQDECVRRFEILHDSVDEGLRPAFANFLDYARRHREIILRFDRFPHRNAILGRESTSAELEFLAGPGSSF